MSSEKSRSEALRWIKTAEDDLDSAGILLRNRKFAHSCFHSQQANIRLYGIPQEKHIQGLKVSGEFRILNVES